MSKNPISDPHSVFHRNGASLLGFAGAAFSILLFGWFTIPIFIVLEMERIVAGFFASYLFTKGIKSTRVRFAGLPSSFPDISHIKFYEHDGHDFVARNVFVGWYVLLPSNWEESLKDDYENFICKLAHEVGHCQKADFNELVHWLTFGLPVAVGVCGMAAYITYEVWHNAETVGDLIVVGSFFTTLIVSIAYLIRQLPALLLSIEHEADKFGYDLTGEKYLEFLDDAAFADSYKKNDSGQRRSLNGFLNKLLHPPFSLRSRYLNNASKKTTFGALFDGLAAGALLIAPPLMIFAYSRFVSNPGGWVWFPVTVLMLYLQTAYFGTAVSLLAKLFPYYETGQVGKFAVGLLLSGLLGSVLIWLLPAGGLSAWKVAAFYACSAFLSLHLCRFSRMISNRIKTPNRLYTEISYFVFGCVAAVIFCMLFVETNTWIYVIGVVIYFLARAIGQAAGVAYTVSKLKPEGTLVEAFSENFDYDTMNRNTGLDAAPQLRKMNQFCHDFLVRIHGGKFS